MDGDPGDEGLETCGIGAVGIGCGLRDTVRYHLPLPDPSLTKSRRTEVSALQAQGGWILRRGGGGLQVQRSMTNLHVPGQLGPYQ